MISSAGIKAYEELFNEIIVMAMEKGVKFGKLQVVDSVYTIADVNLVKDERRKREVNLPEMVRHVGELKVISW